MRRRDLLVIGGAMCVAIAIPPVLRRLPSDFDFEPLTDFPGFRRMAGGAVSGNNIALIGLDDRLPTPYDPPPKALLDPCLALFGPEGYTPEKLPVAIFSDFNCPYCKILDKRLVTLRDSGAPVRLIWHEMPLLGPSSYRSAKAVLAAGFLGKAEAARDYLWNRSLRPGPSALAEMAEALDLLPTMLQREFDGARVVNALAADLDLGSRLGLPGTPGVVIGRTLVIGAIKDADLKKLIDLERSEPQGVCL